LEDESRCRYIHYCPRDTLACRNGECLDAVFKCNGFDDCGDGTDERGCDERSKQSTPIKCAKGQFRCIRGPCITDCPEGDDEEGCPATVNKTVTCAENQFMCDNSCLPLLWKCDGMSDCLDGTDELEERCRMELEEEEELLRLPSRDEYHRLSLSNSFCNASQYLCEPGMCIARTKLCDNHEDCPRGNDEGLRCGECASYGCSHLCTDTPDGPQCSCEEGEMLAVDDRTCVDVNECDTHAGVCSHKCINTERAFRCECFDGYDLGWDKHSCHAKPDPYSAILFSLGSQVRYMPPYSMRSRTGYGIYQHNEKVGTVVRSITFVPSSNQLLMAVSNVDHHGHIHSATDGLQKCVVEGVSGIANLAFDWVARNVYYTAQHPSSVTGVGACRLNGRFCRLLVKGVVSERYYRRQIYRGLVVNPLHAAMYWIDVPGSFDSPKIMAASMDGASVRTLVSAKLEHPQGLAMDYIKQRLYFADIELRLIETVDVVSRERSTVTSQGVHHPYELAFFDNYVYWTDWSTEAVVVSRVNGNEAPHVVHSLEQMPYGLAVNHTSYWNTTMRNPCEDLQCDHLCVLTSGVKGDVVGRCVCPNLYKDSERLGCVPMNATEVEQLGDARKAQLSSDSCCMHKPREDNEKIASERFLTKWFHVPSLCTTMMAEYCEKGSGCLNGGTCVKEVNSHGHVEAITCKCAEGFYGQFCELGSAWSSDRLTGGGGAWLPILLIFLLLAMIAVTAYFASEKCPFIRHAADALLTMRLVQLIIPPDEDMERIIKPKSMVYEADSFSNPSYGVPDKETAPLSNGASPTYNTLPEPAVIPERHYEPPRFTVDSS
uniref:EGF-like domain-containing protein n=1 Tax=Toxocara canis TaxID=6265 RepID=A0A183TWH1_TOXCA